MTSEQRKQLDNILEGLSIAKTYTEAEIKRLAIAHYKEIWQNTPFMVENINIASDKQVKQWMVNFIRHKLTGYDEAVALVNANIPGGYQILKNTVLEKIANMYPFLKDECEKQKEEFYYRRW